MASLKFRHYATESALKGTGTVQDALNAFDVGTIVFIDDTQKQYIITSKSNNVVTYKIYYGKAAVVGVSRRDATLTLTFSDGSEIAVKINNVEHATSADTANTAKSVAWNNVTGKPTNFVTTDDTQTITGAKTFTNNVSLQGSTSADSITTEDLIVNGAARFVSGLTGDLKGNVIGNVTGNVTGNVSGSSGSCTGNALTATTLQTARSINGTSFNGSQAITTAKWGTARTITIADNTNEHTQANNSIDGSADFILKLPTTIKADIIGNASTANSAKSVAWANVTNKPNLVTADTEQTITGAKTFNNNTTFKNETDVESLTVDSLLVTGSARFTNTINGNLKGNIEGDLTGNASTATTAATATEFSTNKDVTLTGDVTGSASSKGGWSIATTIANGAVTNAKLSNSKITIAGTAVSLGGSIAASTIGSALTTSAPAAYATNAGTASKAGEATKAINDSDGNAINTTYLKKSGGTVTGTLTLNGETTVNSTLTANNITADNLTVNGAAKFNGGLEGNLKGDVDGNATTATTCTGNATTATTATNLSNKPSGLFTAATSSADASLTITAGGKTSDAITIGKVKSAFTADNATTATSCSGNAATATKATTATSLGSGALKYMCSLYATDTYNAYKIVTDWHKSDYLMPTINIRGYAYGSASTIDCDIVIYHYNDTPVSYSITNKGSYPIRVWQAIENDVQVFYINPGEYYGMFHVFVYSGIETNSFTNWSMIPVDEISGTEISSKPIATSITGNAATATTASSCTGNAATATTLQNTRKINGTDFNGSADITTSKWGTARNITISDGTNLGIATSVDGSDNIILNLPGTIKANLSGNASTATKATNADRATGDSDGNTINTTYLKRSGGTVTGNVTFNSSVTADSITTEDLIVNGAGRFVSGITGDLVGNVTGNVTGNLSGNASSATKATNDGSGNTITSTYATKTERANNDITAASLNATKLTLTRAAGNITANIPTWNQDTTGTAAKATADAKGNNIVNTYATKAEVAALPKSMVIKGTLDATHTLPTSGMTEGDTYIVGASGTYNNMACKVGDFFVRTSDSWLRIPAGDEWEYNENTIKGIKVNNAGHADTADTAVSAGSATSDSNGDNIANTYARINKVYDDSGDYRQFLGKNGDSSSWIRTTTTGILPYTSGDASNGHSSLGTSSWYFSKAYIQNIYGYLNGNISGSSTSCSGNAATATNVDWSGVTNKPASLPANGGNADTLDEFHITDWGYPYKKVVSCRTTTTLKDLYITIQLEGYAPWNSLGVWCEYNNAWHKLRIYKIGFSEGILVIPSDQNGGVFKQICYDSIYHTTTHKATIYLKMKAILDSTTDYYSPSSEATVYVYALDTPTVTISETAPILTNGKSWSSITSNILVTNKISASVDYATLSTSCTGNSATATKATQDSDGNIINTTYLKRSGGTVTGNVTFNSSVTTDSLTTEDLIVNGSARFVSGLTGDLNGNASSATYATNAGNATTAGNANTIEGISISKLVYGSNSTKTTDITEDQLNAPLASGFYTIKNTTTGSSATIPNATSVSMILHTSYSGLNNNAGFDLLINDSTTSSLHFRPATGAGKGAWKTLIDTGNIGLQSVNYATTSGACTGNAATATKLETARTIWGQSFDGSGNVSGKISNVGDILPATTHISNLGSSSLVWERLYGRYIDTDGGYYLRLCAGGTEVVTITDPSVGSNVGIGTTSPTSKLHVAGTGYFTGDTSSASNIIAGGYIKGETVKISSGCTLEYSSTDKCVRFVFN